MEYPHLAPARRYALEYLRIGFKKGKSVDLYLTSEEVLKVHSAAKKVRTESHLMLGLLRFKKLKGGLYYAPTALSTILPF